MNCPQCQERLDERLDEMRPALRGGTLAPAAARAQAQTAFDAIVADCPECEGELRAYLQLRLSLMTPDAEMASVAVPPNIRVNVRRALEREHLPLPPPAPARPVWKPVKGFAWTGGAILSAIVLFAVARPFLLEKAQQPLSASSSSTDMAPAPMVGQDNPSARVAPSGGAPGDSPRLPGGVPKAASKPPKVGSAPPMSAKSAPPIVGMGAPAPAPANSSSADSVSSAASAKVRQSARNDPQRNQAAKLSPPEMRMMQKPSGPQPPAPIVQSPGPGFGSSGKVGPSLPAEPRLDPKLLAPSGEALGLSVRFVPSVTAREARVRPNVRSAAPPSLSAPRPAFRPAPDKPQEVPANPDALTPPTNPAASSADTSEKAPSGAGKSAGSAGPAAPAPAPPPVFEGSLSVTVKTPVVNARVVGQIKDQAQKETVLWSGKAAANQSIPVPLAPLGAVKGDTVIVSFQQQVSLGETKTLASESVVIP